MTLHVTLAEAQDRLAELVARVGEGEEVLIDEGGRVVAKLGPAPPFPKEAEDGGQARRIGVWSHLKIDVNSDTFLRPDLELEDSMDAPLDPRP